MQTLNFERRTLSGRVYAKYTEEDNIYRIEVLKKDPLWKFDKDYKCGGCYNFGRRDDFNNILNKNNPKVILKILDTKETFEFMFEELKNKEHYIGELKKIKHVYFPIKLFIKKHDKN
jgi:hypothetical protein